MSEGGGLEAGVLEQINFARQHPQEYAEQLRAYRGEFEGRILYRPGDDNGVMTQEGVTAVDEAVDFLERQAPLPPLGEGAVLAMAAHDLSSILCRDGSVGHVPRDGSSPGQRGKRRGGDDKDNKSISYG